MADKLRAQQQLEALQARYVGIGSADTTKHEWTSNIARDSLSSYIGHPPLLQYMSIGLGQSREQTRLQLLERMIRPVGPPPEVSSDEAETSETSETPETSETSANSETTETPETTQNSD
ncbi:hypothetical protein N0V83_010884 [Neocucurbitaria cava]|uniref:Splicing factor subunit n=1 Tax=Neocucurbitaria cava TaxID=798079 RepID=A0A9W8XXE1_9PLEO|nr:hypothetical protein N0V83_010884 [Neocucurbitaria cava]